MGKDFFFLLYPALDFPLITSIATVTLKLTTLDYKLLYQLLSEANNDTCHFLKIKTITGFAYTDFIGNAF